MIVKFALAQYPISQYRTFSDWVEGTRQWVKDGAEQGAEILVFPEYGSMELVSIFEEAIQKDLVLQTTEITNWVGRFLETYEQLAVEFGVIIVAPSIPIKVADKKYNRAFVVSPNGVEGYQDKLFMTRFENEQWDIESPDKVVTVFKYKSIAFGIQICYDIEFAIGSKLLAANGADILFVPSCTETVRGATRVHVGARARAMENQLFTAVSQTIGDALWSPAVDINYGYAAVYSTPDLGLPEEGIVSIAKPQDPLWLVTTVDTSLSKTVREEGAVFNFKDLLRIDCLLDGKSIEVRSVIIEP